MAKKTKQPKIQKTAIKRLASEHTAFIKELAIMDDRVTKLENKVSKLERDNRNLGILRNHEKGVSNKESANEFNISPSRVGQIVKADKNKSG